MTTDKNAELGEGLEVLRNLYTKKDSHYSITANYTKMAGMMDREVSAFASADTRITAKELQACTKMAYDGEMNQSEYFFSENEFQSGLHECLKNRLNARQNSK